jgi:hypothetical protein
MNGRSPKSASATLNAPIVLSPLTPQHIDQGIGGDSRHVEPCMLIAGPREMSTSVRIAQLQTDQQLHEPHRVSRRPVGLSHTGVV